MKYIKYSYIILLVLLNTFTINSNAQNTERLFDIAKNIEIYTNVYKELNKNFVDDIDPSILMKTGIEAMTKSLDPYTVYYSESEAESYKIAIEGKYSGIGTVMKNIDSVITVVDLYKDSPAFNAGLRIGDQILAVNGKSTEGKSTSDITNVVRGAPGTEIEFEILSYGDKSPKTVKVIRDEINIPNVPFKGMVNDTVAYIKLTTFTDKAGANIKSDLKKLMDSFDVKYVILDLRDNGGGLLREAINVVNVFVDKDQELVFTKGKLESQNKSYKTMSNPLDATIPLVVLINGRSASASEIVSGSIQDLDRGVLIGQKSFGKGLVQNFFDVGYNSRLKTTISKYYIPSGRCIQSKTYDNGKAVEIDKSTQSEFSTKNGRKVYDVGGVEPDIVIKELDRNDFINNIDRQNEVFKFANEYFKNHPDLSPDKVLGIDYTHDFSDYLKKNKFKYVTDAEEKVNDLSKTLDMKNSSTLGQLEDMVDKQKSEMETNSKEYLNQSIGNELILRFYLEDNGVKYQLHDDPDIKEAVKLFSNIKEYNKILNKN
ncbi:MAG: S41 family peptidase [Saprospiraceae bacterium]